MHVVARSIAGPRGQTNTGRGPRGSGDPPSPVALSPSQRKHLIGIQAGRGIAAFLVILFHAGRMLSLPQYVGHIPWGNLFNFGHAGVDFFFMLSGFIITYVHRPDIGKVDRLPRYAWRRLTRIYPIYWIVTAAVALFTLFSHDATHSLRLDRVIYSLLLLYHEQPPLVGVAWSLEHEVLFYLVFALAICSRKLGIVLAAAGLLMTAVTLLDWASGNFIVFFGSPYHLQFLMGIGAALTVLRFRFPRPRLLAAAGVVAFIAIGLAENAALLAEAGSLSILLFGAASAAILVGVATAEQIGELRFGAVGALLGAASYSIYLTHTLVIAVAIHVIARFGMIPLTPDWLLLPVMVCVAGTAGIALYWFVERPLGAALRRLADAWRKRRANPALGHANSP